MTQDAKVSSCFFCFFCGEFIVFDCSSARQLGLTPFTEDPRTFKFYNLTVNKLDKSDKSSNMLQVGKQSTVINNGNEFVSGSSHRENRFGKLLPTDLATQFIPTI